jgi:lia operon protein LiaG
VKVNKKIGTMGIIVGGLVVMMGIGTGCSSAGKRITQTATLSSKSVQEINIDCSSANVKLIPEEREDIFVEFETYENGQELFTKEGKTTYIETKSKSKLQFFTHTDYKLTVYIPKNYKESARIDISSGNLTIDEFTFKDLTVDTSSGNIYISNTEAKTIALDVSSGDIVFNEVVCHQLTTKVSSGNIELEKFEGKVKGKSSSGNLKITYLEEMNDIDYSTSSGNIAIDYSMDINAKFNLSTSSGNVNLDYALEEYQTNKEKKIIGTKGTPTYQVDLSVSSGNIRLSNTN